MQAPDAVRDSFRKVQASLKFKVYLKTINGKFYVYRQVSAWDRASRKVKVQSTYIGRIKDDGTYIRKEETSNDELENAKAIIFKHGGKVVMPEEQRAVAEELGFVSDTDRKLLTCLSMNARASRKFIGSIAGLSASAAHYRIKHLEERFGIKYIPEIDTMKLGFLTYLVFVKFYNEKPTLEEIKSAMENEPRVQFVGATSGAYDLVVFILAEDNENIRTAVYTLRSNENLSRYDSRWEVTPFETSYGVLPLRDRFFDVVKEKVWTRTKENPRPLKGSLTIREYDVLRELNLDGMCEFTKIDDKHKLDRGAAQYAYYKLKERGVIKRVSITIEKLPLRYNAIVLLEVINSSGFLKTRDELRTNIISADGDYLTNKYSLVGNIGVPDGGMLIFPVIREITLQDIELQLKAKLNGTKISSLIISNVILGDLSYRSFDNRYSPQYEGLVKRNVIKQEKKQVYEEDKQIAKHEV
ncbi:MAG: AsnC family transcriptional regulator [Candidatus Micrarchaeota archaeon]|nr:AsnC family transcriptional regulator [Candidatus Micrarchaeota archaeon]